MAKIYEYKGKLYSDDDISEENEKYAGDLYDLYWELRQDDLVCEQTVYYSACNPECVFESAEDLIADFCEDMLWKGGDE